MSLLRQEVALALLIPVTLRVCRQHEFSLFISLIYVIDGVSVIL